MGMTIDEIIKTFDYIKHVGNGESEYKHCREEVALDLAIDTLHKYQRIENIIEMWKEDRKRFTLGDNGSKDEYLRQISEVLEDGND